MPKLPLLCLLLLAAASLPISAKPKLVPPKRVGVVIDVSAQVTNHHVGVTAFGNFERRLDNDWALPEFVTKHIEQRLADSGVDFVLIPVEKPQLEQLVGAGCFTAWSGKLTPDCSQRLGQWLAAHEVDAMLHVVSGAGASGALGPPDFSDIGLFTRGTKTPKIAIPVALIWLQLYTADAEGQPPFSNPYACGIGKRIKQGSWVKGVDALTIDDLAWLRAVLEAQIVSVIDDGLYKLGFTESGTKGCSR